MPVVHSSALQFTQLSGREAADPLPRDLLSDGSVRVVRVPPGPRTPHRHPRSSEVVYVVAGTGVAWEDGRRTWVAAGDLLAIPAGVPHATVAGVDGLLLVCFFPHPDLDNNTQELAEPQIDV
jgi:quercetin dioxygenase-like cupin family protein